MADYKKMYAVLCGAVDDIIDTLEEIPLALSSARILRKALEQAEEIYIETTPYRVRFSSALNGEVETAYSIGAVTKRKSLASGGSSSENGGALIGKNSSAAIIRTNEQKSQESQTAVQIAFV